MQLLSPHHVTIIAEAGVNHNGDKDMAYALIDAAAKAGADVVKFQTFEPLKMVAASAPKAAYQQRTTDAHETQLAMLKKLELPKAWHHDLQRHAQSKGIVFASTAFETDSLAFLNQMGMPFFKIPSGELTNAPLVWAFAKTGKPLVISTGMATLGEVEQALAVVCHALAHDQEPTGLAQVMHSWTQPAQRAALRQHVTLLHCTSQYPTPLHEVNLRAMTTLAQAFGLSVGYSDHTEGILVPLAAVALGATVIEKHFTLDRCLPGPDHVASLEPAALTEMVNQIRGLQLAMGDGCKVPFESELDTRAAARQQVVARRDIAQGAVIAREDLGTARCGGGQAPITLWELVGTTAPRAYRAGDVF